MADLSRGVVPASRDRSLIVNVPGSPRAALENLEALAPTCDTRSRPSPVPRPRRRRPATRAPGLPDPDHVHDHDHDHGSEGR